MADRVVGPATLRNTEGDERDGIRDALLRLESALACKPGFGRATQSAVTALVEGVRCQSTEREYTIASDLPGSLGGAGTAPSPGALLRAALGSCLAMNYKLRAARQGIALRSVRVEVETESSVAGMLHTDADVPAGFTRIRYHVEIAADAPREAIIALVDEADRLSPMLDAVGRANHPTRTLSIVECAG